MTTCFHHGASRAIGIGVRVGLLVAICTGTAAAAEIALRPEAIPRGTVVRLGDVANIRDDSVQETKRLAALPLMPAPASGSQRFLRMREVQDLLAAQGEDLSRLHFRGELVTAIAPLASDQQSPGGSATENRLRRQSAWLGAAADVTPVPPADIDHEKLHRQIQNLIIDHLNRSSGQTAPWQVDFNLSGRDLRQTLAAASAIECSGGAAPWTGKQRLVISFATAQGDVRLPVFATVRLPQPVVVAVRPIQRGQIVSAADVELHQLENVPPSSVRHMPIDAVEKLIGLEAARPIQVGETIYSDLVQRPLLVKRGEEVAVYARGGGISVRTRARARQDGARGELVQVESLETQERYNAVVTGLREAVVFAGSVAPAADVAEQPFRRARR